MRASWCWKTGFLLALFGAGAGAADPPVQSGLAEVREPRLYYEMAGKGEAVVLIHGGNLDSRMWDGQFALLAKAHRVIRYDVRGFGRSRQSDVVYTDYDDLRDLLDFLRVERAVLVGLSMGGRIAVDLALAHPERVRALVLAGPGISGFRFAPEAMARFYQQVHAAQRGDWDKALQSWLEDPYMIPAMEQAALRPRLIELGRDNVRTVLMNWMLQRGLDPPAVDRLGEIHVPTLLLVGERDVPDIHTIGKLLAEKVPGIEKRMIPGSGHLPNLEKPGEFNRLLLDFLRRLPPAPEGR